MLDDNDDDDDEDNNVYEDVSCFDEYVGRGGERYSKHSRLQVVVHIVVVRTTTTTTTTRTTTTTTNDLVYQTYKDDDV
jgi:hypothetical protein